MKLYRATNRKSDTKTIPAGTCWSDSEDAARAYTANQGYGGKYIVSVDVKPANPLDLRGDGWERDNWDALTDAVGRDLREDWTDGDLEYPEQAIDDPSIRAELRGAGYDWVIYHDTYPRQCTTYVRL